MSPAKRQVVLASALSCFLESGYAGTSMAQVASAAGSSKQTVYNLFGSKDALFEEAVAALWSGVPMPSTTEVLTAQTAADARHVLTQAGMQLAGFWQRSSLAGLLHLLVRESASLGPVPCRVLRGGPAALVDAVAEMLCALDQRGMLRVAAPRIAALQWLGLINEPLLWSRALGVEAHSCDEEQVVTAAVDMFMACYGT